MPGRIASLDDLPPSVVPSISEACRCAVNDSFARLDDRDNTGSIREICHAFVSGGMLIVEYLYNGAPWHLNFDLHGFPRGWVEDGWVSSNPVPHVLRHADTKPRPKPWYLSTGKADLDYENQP